MSAEYANYRKRVDRDRAMAGEHATGAVLTALFPVLDDIGRAREHGDLEGAFKAVAEAVEAGLSPRPGWSPSARPGSRSTPPCTRR